MHANRAMLSAMSRTNDTLTMQSALAGYGLVRLPLREAAAAIEAPGWTRREMATGQPLSAALDFLEIVTWPATRYGLFSLGQDWTVILNNQRGGSDVADLLGHMKSREPAMSVRVADHDGSFAEQNGFRVRKQYGARIVEIQSDGETQRSIACADDGGRWTFVTAGTPLPIEAQFDYSARRIRDRFTSQNLEALLRDIGARAIAPTDLQHEDSLTLVTLAPRDRERRRRIQSRACSTAEADDPAHGYFRRGMGWTEHMGTHATSVVADLGKAMLLNPEFQPRCQPALDQARAQLGDAGFADALSRAHEGLDRI